MKEFLSNSYLFGANAPFIEELYEAYLDNPQSVPEQWREYFDKLQLLPRAKRPETALATWPTHRSSSPSRSGRKRARSARYRPWRGSIESRSRCWG